MDPCSAAVSIISWYVISHHCSEILSPGGNFFLIQSSSRKPKNDFLKTHCHGAKESRGKENATHSLESKGYIYPEYRMSWVKTEVKTLSYLSSPPWGKTILDTTGGDSYYFGRIFPLPFSCTDSEPIRASFPQHT